MTRSPWAVDPERLRAALAVYLVADPEQSASGDLIADTSAALAGGATCVQLRTKNLTDLDAFHLAAALVGLCRGRNVPFLVNDRLDVTLAVGADGLHVGLTDLPIAVVRRLSQDHLLIGWSPETEEQVAAATAEGADYIGIGPIFPTGSKADAAAVVGLDGLARRTALTALPTVGIGGIDAGNAAAVIGSGADGVAVISAILRADDPADAARELRAAVDRARRSDGR